MEDYERRKRREREKIERQQGGVQSVDRETSLFPEPRRVNPSEGDDEITATLGNYLEARDYINQYTVGISNSAHRQVPTSSGGVNVGNNSASAPGSGGSTSVSASQQRLQPPIQTQQQQQQQQKPSAHHYQQQPQQNRPGSSYIKQADNKPPYNGRGGYPGQPMKNDIRSSSGMAPPRGPPNSSTQSSNTSSLSLPPPATTQMPNGRSSITAAAAAIPSEKAFLVPPSHNGGGGRFLQPPMMPKRQNLPEKDVTKIISEITNNFSVTTPLTEIAATPHTTIRENYNLNGPNKHIYAFDTTPITPIGPLGSPPQRTQPIVAPPALVTPIAPRAPISSPIAPLTTPLMTPVSSAAITALRNEKSTLKPLKTEKCERVTLEKQDSCLENDLELSESDDDHKKDSRSGVNSSESSPSDSSDSGSDEESTKDDHQLQQLQQLQHQQQQQQQQQQQHQQMLQRQLSNASSNGSSGGNSSKKISQTIIATGGNSISSIFVSSGLSSVGSTSSGIGTHSSSSSNKTPSPTDSKKWDLSRFFSKPTSQQTQESGVSPGSVGSVSCGNVSMKVPGILPGGAQIIPEAMDVTTAIVKNENDDDNDDDEDDDDDNNVGDAMSKARVADLQAAAAIRYGAGLSVTPMSTVAIKKEAADVITSSGVQKVPMLNASDCVAIPKGQIKRESSLMEEHRRQEGLARLSESNSDSDSPNDAVTVPMPGPGGTLQIPRVPATITALPRHPLGAPSKLPPPPTLHNSVTLTPIAPLPTSPKPTRQKKVRKKKQPPVTAPSVDSSDEEGIRGSKKVPDFHTLQMNAMNMVNVGNMTTANHVSSLNAVAAASAALATASAAPVAQRKGRGRPRKQHQQPLTPKSQSGNLSSASSNAKGPTLTANKVVPKKPKAINSRRRDNSSNSSTSTTPTKAATKIVAAVPVPLLHAHNNNNLTKHNMHNLANVAHPPANAVNSSSEDSSSSSSESFSHSKSSSSSSTDSDSDRSTQSKLRRVVKLNKAGAAPAAPIVSSPSTTTTSDDDDDVPPRIAASGPSTTDNAPPAGRGSQHQLQSPFKAGERSARSHVSTSSSSTSSSSSSDDDVQTDSDEGASHKKKLRREKPKINRNKINTLTRIFNPKEGGAKKQGQVVIIDQSEEMLANKQQQQAAAAAAATAVASSAAHTSQQQQSSLKHSLPNNLYQKSDQPPSAMAAQSPRLLSGSMRSPRNAALHSSLQQQQRIKTPTRTPPTTRTPTPTHQMLQQQTAAAAAAASPARTSTPILTSLICKIDITRLLRISPEWQNNNYRLYGVRNAIVVGGHTPNTTAGRTPIYDHETILNADLQASTAQMRLKVAGNSSTRSGSRTPTTTTGILSNSTVANHTNLPNADRELSRSRESLHEMGSNGGKQRLETCDVVYPQNGHLSSRSTDGATTPKQSPYYPASLTPNGYTSATSHSPSSAKLAHGTVKHEHIKYEPDVDAAYDSKAVFKPSSVKQEHQLLHLKQDLKPQPGELQGKLSPPDDGNGDTKPRRKRSTSSSSSPYKEKKRKKEKPDRDNAINTKEKELDNNVVVTTHAKELLMLEQQMPHTNHDRLLLDKQQLLQEAHVTNNNNSNNNNNNVNIIATSPTTQHMLKVATVAPMKALCVVMPPPPVSSSVDQQQHSAMPPSTAVSIAGAPQVIYRSYFERDEEQLSDDFRKNNQFLQEAITRKHAADDEKDSFNQVTLYLEAVVYFLLTGAAMERHNDNAAWTMYKDTLTLIKFISTKFRSYQVSSTNGQHETHNKVAILSLRCQSLISLKLYKLRRAYCRTIINVCSDFFKNGKGDIVNGNTPSSSSPSNSVCSQGSGSNTPPGKIVPQDIHNQLLKQNEFFTYLTSSHELWDQADRLVRQGNHTLFFIALDHENGPLTLHSTMYEVFRYVQAGLKRLRDAMSSGSGTNAAATAIGGINAHHMMQ